MNAFYSRYRNAIILPIGILNRHIFNEEHPNYMNFASLGYIVGHEVIAKSNLILIKLIKLLLKLH